MRSNTTGNNPSSNKAPDRGGQPAPIHVEGGPSMHDLLVEEIQKRKSLGLSRYGTILQAGNGRDALQDAIDEGIDMLVYLLQLKTEAKATPTGPVDLSRLHSTTDVMVWAEEFTKIVPGVDQALMMGWFANAMQTAVAYYKLSSSHLI